MTARRAVRRAIPFALRWRLRAGLRAAADARDGTRFARGRGADPAFQHTLCSYDMPLRCYPGQEALFAGKRRNLELALGAIDRTVLAPNGTFSFWRLVGRPTAAGGYTRAAALKGGVLTEDVGGSICLASTLLYNIALLGGLSIGERWCHSVDTYGDQRYFELGRDAAVEYAYRDLRFRNDHAVPLLLHASCGDGMVSGTLRSAESLGLKVRIVVSEPEMLPDKTMRVCTRRTVEQGGRRTEDVLGESVYLLPG